MLFNPSSGCSLSFLTYCQSLLHHSCEMMAFFIHLPHFLLCTCSFAGLAFCHLSSPSFISFLHFLPISKSSPVFSSSILIDVTCSVWGTVFQPPTAYLDYSISNLLPEQPDDCFSKVLFMIEVKCTWDYCNNHGGKNSRGICFLCRLWLWEKNVVIKTGSRSSYTSKQMLTRTYTQTYTHMHARPTPTD